jgi:hypothetical protein
MNGRSKATLVAVLVFAALFESLGPVAVHAQTASITPSSYWGVFFGTVGDITITVKQQGIAVRIGIPREFIEPHAENDTSFLSSTITDDYFYYLVTDDSLHYPYKEDAPFRVEIHNPRYVTFNSPQYIFMRDLRAPSVAGIYNFTIYIATSLSPYGRPIFPPRPTENLSVPVSMREDPSSISGYILDPPSYYYTHGIPIRANGIVYATEVGTGAKARAYVNPRTGYYNLTGLWAPGTYKLSASAGYCPETGFAYLLTEMPQLVTLKKTENLHQINITLIRGCKIQGTVFYTTPSGESINSLDNPWLKNLGFSVLNYTVEAYDLNGRFVGGYSNVSANEKSDNFTITGLEYVGFGPGVYNLKAWVFAYTQGATTVPTLVMPESSVSANITLIHGGVISGKIRLPETPRVSEIETLSTSTDTYYGGHIVIEAFDPSGFLKGLTLANGTGRDGRTLYADSDTIKFYILGFSEFYNRTLSGVWKQRDYGLEESGYSIHIWLRGYIQPSIAYVTIAKGGNSTVEIWVTRTGAVKTSVVSMNTHPPTGNPQSIVAWRFGLQGYWLRIYYYESATGLMIGYADKQLSPDPDVSEFRANVTYTGNNWPLDLIIYRGSLPSSVAEGDYLVNAFTYGYVQRKQSTVRVQSGMGGRASVILQLGAGINGTVPIKKDGLYLTALTENVFARIEARSPTGLLSGAQTLAIPAGSIGFIFRVYGFCGGSDHFYYVAPDGTRFNDYGLEQGTYFIQVLDFGYTYRYRQTIEVSVNFPGIDFIVGVNFDVNRLGKILGTVRGLNATGSPVPLSWATINSASILEFSQDGGYVVHLPEGTYTFTYSAPGYVSQSYTVIVTGSSETEVNIILSQAGTPFSLVQLRIVLQRTGLTIQSSYVITAEIYVNGILNDLAEYTWTCDGGHLNSTNGKAVEWTGANSAKTGTYSIEVKALVPRYGEAFGSVTISITPIPEFSLLQVVLVSLLSITVVSTRVLSKRLSKRYAKLSG